MAKRLVDLMPGESGVVGGLDGADETMLRLCEMGVTRGAQVDLLRIAPMGDPIEARVRGGSLTIRKSQARRVFLMSKREYEAYLQQTLGMTPCASCRILRTTGLCNRDPARVALIGNPNVGKTTLFNALTGARAYAGNRPGVTVAIKQRRMRLGDLSVTICDLPGIYALGALSRDERVASDFLLNGKPDAAIYVADATSLRRGLYLALQIMERGIPIVLALNMADELENKGLTLNTSALSNALGVSVMAICARTGEGVDRLKAALFRTLTEPLTMRCPCFHASGDPIADAGARYDAIERICQSAVSQRGRMRVPRGRVGGVFTHRVWGIPIFLLLMAAVFYLTFDSLGAWLSLGAETLVGYITAWLNGALCSISAPAWCVGLVCEGLCAGVGAVVAFLPQIALLFLFLSLLEDSGYLARTAFLMDRALRSIGLSGKSFIPLLLGFGCTVPAAMCARTMEHDDTRNMTILLLPFASCSAKLPVYGMIASALFKRSRGFTLLLLYCIGALCGAFSGLLFGKTLFRRSDAPFLMEMPPYRVPTLRNTLLHVGERVFHFLSRAGTAILLISVGIWALTRLDGALRMTADVESSLLADVGRFVAPLFRPLGFGNWQTSVTLVCALAAKEAAVSALTLVAGASGVQTLFSPASGFAFLVFVLLYSPCIAALSTMRRELGSALLTLFMALYQTALAYLVALLAYRLLLLV